MDYFFSREIWYILLLLGNKGCRAKDYDSCAECPVNVSCTMTLLAYDMYLSGQM